MSSTPRTWEDRADIAQRSLDHYFGTEWPQYLENNSPVNGGDATTFNYWWLAHVMDARIDAWERSGNESWLQAAARTRENILERNHGSLFNDYFDDMLWFALALLRLHEATGELQYRLDAEAIWDHVIEFGWNDHRGPSLAWRKQQLEYKNTPANGPLVILSLRLARHASLETGYAAASADSSRDYEYYARAAFDWLTANLVGNDGFVEDGVNREGDGRVDTQWRFTYNQGLYVGAAVELHRWTGDAGYPSVAVRTALVAIHELSDGTVFRDEGNGGDEGLFKGVYYRYLGQLVPLLSPESNDRRELERFIRASTDALWETCARDELLRAHNNWSKSSNAFSEDEPIPYSTQVSAIMAIELRCRVEEPSLWHRAQAVLPDSAGMVAG